MHLSKLSHQYYVSALALTVALMSSTQIAAQTSTDTEVDTKTNSEIIVTARKREETKLEIPISVSAFSQDTLNELGITDAASLSNFSPGFKFENDGTGGFSGRANPQIRFRGVGVQASTPASRAGAIFWDGAYISDGAGVIPLIDLERVEVIKGPQTAFFGRNTFSGAVNLIPAAPTKEFGGKVIGELTSTGQDTGHDLTGIVNIPISDRLSTRIAIHDSKDAADFEYGDGSPLGEYNTTAIIGSVHFDVTDNIKIKYSGAYVDADDTSIQISQPGTVEAGDCGELYTGTYRNVATGESNGTFSTDLSTTAFGTYQCGSIQDWDAIDFDVPSSGIPDDSLNSPGFTYTGGFAGVQVAMDEFGGDMLSPPEGFGNTYKYWRNHLSTDIDLTSGHTVSALISNSTMQSWSILDALFGTGDTVGEYRVEGYATQTKDLSFEARISSPGNQRLRYTLGSSLYHQETISGNYGQNQVTLQDGDNFGIFGSLDYDLTEAFTLSGEVRWHDDEQVILYQGLPGGDDENAVTDQSQSYNKFMPRAILSYNPTSNLNIYGSWSKSYLQGVPTNAVAYGIAEPTSGINEDTVGLFTDIQELDSYEIGIKQNLTDKFNYSAALYQMDWQNQVFFQLNNTFATVFLPGDSEYTGLEIEFEYDLTNWFRLSSGFNFVDAKFTDFGAGGTLAFRRLAPEIASTDQIDAAGNSPRYIPASSGSIAGEFDLTGLFGRTSFARIDAIYTGDFYLDNLEYNKVDAYTKFNARIGMDLTEKTSLEVYGNNLTDDQSWGTAGGTTGYFSRKSFGSPIEGRELGVKVTAEF